MSDSTSGKPGCLGMLLNLLGLGAAKPQHYRPEDLPSFGDERLPYRLRDDFLSPAEISFYHVLRQTLGERATVCAKVGLGDLFFVSRPNENAGARNRIAAKHVDFLLCDPATMRPLAGIELDDASHARPDRQERDALVQKVFEAAGLPLVRFPAQRGYALAEVAGRLATVLDGGAAAVPVQTEAAAVNSVTAPMCPKCGIVLVVRSGPRGNFYGCSNFPKCRETAQVD